MKVDLQLLEKILQYLATGGASALASWALEKSGRFQKLSSEHKVYVGYVVTGLIGIAAYFAMMGMLYVPVPQGYVEWIETLVAVGFTAAGVTQIYHKVQSLRSK